VTRRIAPEQARALREINARHAARWEIAHRLTGGYSDRGAHVVRDGERRAVLKVHGPGRTAERMDATAAVIAAAIDAGWSTPRWLAHGVLTSGESYVIREFVEGTVPRRLGEIELELLLEINRRQTNLHPDIDADWSAYARQRLFGEGLTMTGTDQHREVAMLRDQLERFITPARDVVLPTTDVVHGDVTLLNTIISGERAWLIDAEYAGKGSRSYDLATLLVHAGTGALGASPKTMARLRDECVRIAGEGAARLGVAVRIIGLVDFGSTHWPEGLPSFAAGASTFLESFD